MCRISMHERIQCSPSFPLDQVSWLGHAVQHVGAAIDAAIYAIAEAISGDVARISVDNYGLLSARWLPFSSGGLPAFTKLSIL